MNAGITVGENVLTVVQGFLKDGKNMPPLVFALGLVAKLPNEVTPWPAGSAAKTNGGQDAA